VLRGRLAVPDEKQLHHNGHENWNTEGRGAYAASIPGRAFQFQGMNDGLGAFRAVRAIEAERPLLGFESGPLPLIIRRPRGLGCSPPPIPAQAPGRRSNLIGLG